MLEQLVPQGDGAACGLGGRGPRLTYPGGQRDTRHNSTRRELVDSGLEPTSGLDSVFGLNPAPYVHTEVKSGTNAYLATHS